MSLIEQINKWIEERGSAAVLEKNLAFLRDQIADMETRHLRENADLKVKHEREISTLKAQQFGLENLPTQTGLAPCPSCGQKKWQDVVRRPALPPRKGYVQIYKCGGCGHRLERHSP